MGNIENIENIKNINKKESVDIANIENKENLHLYFSNEEYRNTNWQNSSDKSNRKQRRTKSLLDISEEIFKSRFPVLLDNRKN